jgi:hypothetical protein
MRRGMTMAVRHSVDVDKLEEFRSFLKDNPKKGHLRLQAKAVYEGQAGRSTVHIGPFGLDETNIDRQTRHYTPGSRVRPTAWNRWRWPWPPRRPA